MIELLRPKNEQPFIDIFWAFWYVCGEGAEDECLRIQEAKISQWIQAAPFHQQFERIPMGGCLKWGAERDQFRSSSIFFPKGRVKWILSADGTRKGEEAIGDGKEDGQDQEIIYRPASEDLFRFTGTYWFSQDFQGRGGGRTAEKRTWVGDGVYWAAGEVWSVGQ